MKQVLRTIVAAVFCAVLLPQTSFAQNQTPTVSTVYPQDSLPFTIQLETANFSLPNGLSKAKEEMAHKPKKASKETLASMKELEECFASTTLSGRRQLSWPVGPP